VLCEVVNRADGSMARTPQLQAFAREHGLRVITIADLIRYRLRHEQLLRRVAAAQLDTRYGPFTAVAFRSSVDGLEHAALVAGGLDALAAAGSGSGSSGGGVLARVQLQRRLTDVFGSLHCGQGPFMDQALQAIAAEGCGVLLYVAGHQQPGAAGAGGSHSTSLAAELQEYAAEQAACSIDAGGASSSGAAAAGGAAAAAGSQGAATLPANRDGPSTSLSGDLRDAAAAAHMLRHLGVSRVRLLSGDAREAQQLRCCGVEAEAVGMPASSSSSSGSSNCCGGGSSGGRGTGSGGDAGLLQSANVAHAGADASNGASAAAAASSSSIPASSGAAV
jgi:3,4-dihydroxy 2-butanone 4-phosphate synthase/GTP cyclohydrolase II